MRLRKIETATRDCDSRVFSLPFFKVLTAPPRCGCLGRWFKALSPAIGWILLTVTALAQATGQEPHPSADESFRVSVLPLLKTYCFTCHDEATQEGGIRLEGLERADRLHDTELWLKVLKNVRAQAMPPRDEPQPSPDERLLLENWIKRQAFSLDEKFPDPGRVVLRRLNRVEYRNTIRDLIGVDFDTTEELIADDTGYGFDNIGSVLTVSPTLLDKLLVAAQKVIVAAVPMKAYIMPSQNVPGNEFTRRGQPERAAAPAATGLRGALSRFAGRGALSALSLSFYEPAIAEKKLKIETAGTYELLIEIQTAETRTRGSVSDNQQEEKQEDENHCTASLKVDGVRVWQHVFDRTIQKTTMPVQIEFQPGEHALEFALEPVAADLPKARQLQLRLNAVAVKGPLEREKWIRPPRYEEFFGKGVPVDAAERRLYSTQLLEDFATRAYRRPVDAVTVARLVTVAETVAAQRDHTLESGLAQAMVAVLASPRFIFREEGEETLLPGQKYPLVDEYTLASRLSYFLWSSMPDEELFRLAKQHQLRAHLNEQVERMLQDQKFSRFISDFTGQWLQARDAVNVVIDALSIALRDKPDPEIEDARKVFRSLIERDPITYTPDEATAFNKAESLLNRVNAQPKPQLTARLRPAMRQETEMLFAYILREDRSVLELLDSDYAFLNEELAQHYGIPGVTGTQLRKVTLPADSPRGGVLTQATVLTVTSNPTRTSPVKRGVFILDNILGLPPAPPPPDIPPLEAVADPETVKKLSMRESMALHSKNALCASCHSRMDPLGLALDHFNALGVWRESELNQPIDASGRLISGEVFSGIRDLKKILVSSRRLNFYNCLSEKLLTYATGRVMDYTDTVLLDNLVSRLDATEGKMSVLMKGIIASAAFQQRRSASLVSAAK